MNVEKVHKSNGIFRRKVFKDLQQEARFQEIVPFSIKKINEDKQRFQASVK